MSMQDATHVRLQEVLTGLDCTVTIDSISSVGTVHTILTDDTAWIIPNQTITIGADEYTVSAVTPNVSFVMTHATADPSGTTEIEIAAPNFRHGTPMAVDREITDDKTLEWEKYPLIWLRERVVEEFSDDPESSIERTSDCELHLLYPANHSEWSISDHSAYAIQPMRNLAARIYRCLKDSQYVANISIAMTLEDVMNWGVYEASKGHVAQLFNANLSGVIQKVSIPFLKGDCD
jgi:hypothetical protein